MSTTQTVAPATTDARTPSPSTLPPAPLRRRRFTLGTLFLILLGCGLMVGGVIGTDWLLHGRANDGKSDSAPVDAPSSAVGFGHVDVENRVANLSPVQTGEVIELPYKEGDHVKKGAVLLKVDPQPAKFAVETAQAALKNAEAVLKAANVSLAQAKKVPEQYEAQIRTQAAAIEVARKEWGLADILRQTYKRELENMVGKQDRYDAAIKAVEKADQSIKVEEERLNAMKLKLPQLKLDIDRAEIDVERAKLDVAAKQTLLEQAKYTLDKCDLKAPSDGEVLRVLVSVGDLLISQPKEAAIMFCPDEKRIIRAEIQQEDAAHVKVGQPAHIEDDARLAGQWKGKVKRISDWYSPRRSLLLEPRQFNDVRTLECIIELDDPKDLRIGQRVRVTLGK